MTAKELGAEPANPAEVTFSMDGIIQGMKTGDRSYKSLGLSKREYFAGLAMQGLLACPNSDVTDIIRSSVVYADALLEELAKESEMKKAIDYLHNVAFTLPVIEKNKTS